MHDVPEGLGVAIDGRDLGIGRGALEVAGLRSLRFHDLRHTFGTRMISKADTRRVPGATTRRLSATPVSASRTIRSAINDEMSAEPTAPLPLLR